VADQFPGPTKMVLSSAQKIVAAFNDRHELCGPFDDDWVEQCLAAALRAAADHLGSCNASTELIAIATELETQ
jgi:hypothetical protein